MRVVEMARPSSITEPTVSQEREIQAVRLVARAMTRKSASNSRPIHPLGRGGPAPGAEGGKSRLLSRA